MDWLTDWRCWDLSKRFLLQGSASTCYITVLPSQHDLNWVFSSTWSRCIIFCLLHYISIGPKKPAWSLWIKGKQSKAMNTFLPCLSLFFHFFLPALATIGWLLTWYTHSYPYRINRSNLEDLLFWAMCYILKRTCVMKDYWWGLTKAPHNISMFSRSHNHSQSDGTAIRSKFGFRMMPRIFDLTRSNFINNTLRIHRNSETYKPLAANGFVSRCSRKITENNAKQLLCVLVFSHR